MANEIDLSQFHEVFFEEAFEGLGIMEAGLLGLEPGRVNDEVINNVFRAAHSIKGGAGTFGFEQVTGFTHVLETLLDDLRSGDIAVSDELTQLLLEATDYLKHLLTESQASREVDEAVLLEHTEKLSNFTASDVAVGAEVLQPEETSTSWHISFLPHRNLFASGNDPYRILRELQEFGSMQVTLDTGALPDFDDLDPEECYLSWQIYLNDASATERELYEVFEWVADDAEVTIAADGATLAAPAPVAEEESSLDTVTAATPEVTSIRVNIDKVDDLVNLVGELVITQSMLSRFKNLDDTVDRHQLARDIEQLEENTRDLQEQAMRIRMLPIDTVFQRIPRLVHDLSKNLGKDVELVMNGRSTEVDKTVLEKITDPLTHLVRNSLDHGIESPDERLAAGKPAKGVVELRAYHEGGCIMIEVSDDGRGLSRDLIVSKAIAKGVIDAGAELSDTQIDHLIFAPGFSTATEVSDVSGRGVGMDVVKNNIEQLGGNIDVMSTDGRGTTFVIKLPLTLAIIEGQLVRVGRDVYVIPLLSIVKSTQMMEEEHRSIAGHTAMYRLEDDYIPIVPLKDVYNVSADYEKATDGILVIVDAMERYGVLVDEVLEQQQVVVKSLETNFRNVPTISGATILGDGRVAMILDMSGLLRHSKREEILI